MADNSKISWTTHTWNCAIGCSRVSPGCQRCYAETLALRWGWSKKPWTARNAKENVILKPHRLREPYKWKEGAYVFVNSLSDVFHEEIPDSYIDAMFDVMADLPRHRFQILTKRPERMREYMLRYVDSHGTGTEHFETYEPWMDDYALPNVWLGVSVEDQRRADERIPVLLDTPSAVRFLSCEPLLGPVGLWPWLNRPDTYWTGDGPSVSGFSGFTGNGPSPISWVIVGGESGPKYRPMDLAWAERLRDHCVEAGVPFFFKQVSGPRPGMGEDALGRLWHEFPDVPDASGSVTQAALV